MVVEYDLLRLAVAVGAVFDGTVVVDTDVAGPESGFANLYDETAVACIVVAGTEIAVARPEIDFDCTNADAAVDCILVALHLY